LEEYNEYDEIFIDLRTIRIIREIRVKKLKLWTD